MTPRPAISSRFRLTLGLTHRCDLACPHCYAGRARAVDMPLDTALQALDWALVRVAPGGVLELVLFGGEPLLVWPLVEAVLGAAVTRCDARRVTLTGALTTNGTGLTPERLAALERYGVRVCVSLDGAPPVHDAQRPHHDGRGSAALVAARVRALGPAVARLSSTMVVHPARLDRLVDGVAWILDQGIEQIQLECDLSADWPASALDRLESAGMDLVERYCDRVRAGRPFALSWIDGPLAIALSGRAPRRCGFGEGEIAVAPSGRVYPCERLIGEDRDATGSIGTIDALVDAAAPSCPPSGNGDPFGRADCRCSDQLRGERGEGSLHRAIGRLRLSLAEAVAERLDLVPLA